MSGIEERLSDICEGYFRALERDCYRPEGCNGDDLAKVLIAELGLRDVWGTGDGGTKPITTGETEQSARDWAAAHPHSPAWVRYVTPWERA